MPGHAQGDPSNRAHPTMLRHAPPRVKNGLSPHRPLLQRIAGPPPQRDEGPETRVSLGPFVDQVQRISPKSISSSGTAGPTTSEPNE